MASIGDILRKRVGPLEVSQEQISEILSASPFGLASKIVRPVARALPKALEPVTQPIKQFVGAQQSKFKSFVERVARRQELESKGQEVLNSLEEVGRGTGQVASEFFGNTFNKLSTEQQRTFAKLVKKVTGLGVGDVLSVDAKTGKRVPVKNLGEILQLLPGRVEFLEGTERGLVSLMESANRTLGLKGLK